uniref:Uncharacterized protein n=1 Tax=Amphimedon queenslandica TaxID=400682 RepID=A0A1X7TC76_AMPQE
MEDFELVYTENDETFDTFNDLSKDEDIGAIDISEVLIPDYVSCPMLKIQRKYFME